MKTLILVLCVLFILIVVSECYYDSEEYLYPRFCDTTNITFAQSVKPILQDHCYFCHSNSTFSNGGGIRLEDYADVKTKADDGSLLGSITHTTGFSAMPMGTGKLEDCKITFIQTWIGAGSPDN